MIFIFIAILPMECSYYGKFEDENFMDSEVIVKSIKYICITP